VTITTTPSDARVLVDGRLAASSSSPYSLSDLPAGKHELLVQKSGFVDYHASFALSRGEQKTLPPVELVASVREVGFSIRSAPPGAEVWIDGRATDQLTPAKFADVASGVHRLQLKRPGYADYELQMIVPDATLLQLTADLVPTSNPVAAPPPAAAVREKPARAETETSLSAETNDSPRPSHAWHAKSSSSTSSAFSSSPSPARMSMPTPVASAAAPVAAGHGGAGGTLRVNSRPWAQIFVDGRPMGNTPQPNLRLTPGNHKIQLVNQPMGLSKSFSVNVKPGDVITKVMNLAE
jgi:serine/threonine-protein kinase